MDELKKLPGPKLPGPFTLLMAARRSLHKIVIVIVLLVLYVLSSGPTQMIAFRSLPGPGRGLPASVDLGKWWPKVYAPLVWMVDERLVESWSKTLKWYWRLFPIP